METKQKEFSPEILTDYVRHFQKSRVLLTAVELGIFTVIGIKSVTSSDVAKKIKTNVRATDKLMNALVALDFLQKRKDKFSNTLFSAKYLVVGKPEYMSGLMHSVNMWYTWTTLTDCVKKGHTVCKRPKMIDNRDKKWLDAFISAMHYRAFRQAPEIVKLIDLKNIKKVLDIGGGSGAYAMSFADAGKNITATVFDLPNVLPITKRFIKQNGYAKKVDTLAGDYNTSNIPNGYDLIFISAVVHINSYMGNARLIKKCANALSPGGMIVIQDHVMNDDRTSPAPGAMFALNMLVGTEEGDTYTEKEMKEWFSKAGIRFLKRIPVDIGNSLIIGKKQHG
jgi:2-polyprenyl-3-methyl-5-hydroxy-6-metoxy-1,4-benzoquinol methylase